MQRFEIFITERTSTSNVIRVLRRWLPDSVAELKGRINSGEAIVNEKPHHNQFDEFVGKVNGLIGELDAHKIGYTVKINGRAETVEYFGNVFARWEQIGRELEEYDDRILRAEGEDE